MDSENLIALSLAVASIALLARKERAKKERESRVVKRRRKNRLVYGKTAREKHSLYHD